MYFLMYFYLDCIVLFYCIVLNVFFGKWNEMKWNKWNIGLSQSPSYQTSWYPFKYVVMYAVQRSFYQRSSFTALKSTVEGRSKIEDSQILYTGFRGAGKARFNVATPTNATVTCTAYVLPYNFQTKSI